MHAGRTSNYVIRAFVRFAPRTLSPRSCVSSLSANATHPTVHTDNMAAREAGGTVPGGWSARCKNDNLDQCIQYLISKCERCYRPLRPSKFRQESFIMDRKSCCAAQGGGGSPHPRSAWAVV